MALSKVDYNSLNVTAAASKALKWNSGADGFETGDIAGALVLLETITASSDSTIEFDSGIDDTYDEYIIKYINVHPGTDDQKFLVNFRDGSTAYDAIKTTSFFLAYNNEADTSANLVYSTSADLAQGTGGQRVTGGTGNDNDLCSNGYLHLFNPSSTTFVKHFIGRSAHTETGDSIEDAFVAGYCNTTSAIDGVQFAYVSGNIDAGTFKLYGVT